MKKEIRELIDKHADIEFSYKGKEYTILAWIDEKPFKDIFDDIIITFSS